VLAGRVVAVGRGDEPARALSTGGGFSDNGVAGAVGVRAVWTGDALRRLGAGRGRGEGVNQLPEALVHVGPLRLGPRAEELADLSVGRRFAGPACGVDGALEVASRLLGVMVEQ